MEAIIAERKISWASPLAQSLMRAQVGELVTFQTPAAQRELEVISIEYRN